MMQCTDAVALGEPRVTRDGYLVVDAQIARTGIQTYSGVELGKPHLGSVRVYRPDREVFADRAMSSFAHRPVTINHPSRMVTSDNWKEHAVGMTGDSVVRDGTFVRVPFTLMDQAAIDGVKSGHRELSCGYLCELDWTAGATEAGEQYDAVQTKITGNHLAVVARGRAGSACRIGDSWTTPETKAEDRTMPDNLRTVLVDGLTISTTDQGAQAIEKLQGQLRDAGNALAAKDAAATATGAQHVKALEAKDGELAGLKASHVKELEAKDGEIAALKAKLPDAAAMDAMIAEREATIASARKVLGDAFDPKGKSDLDIRRAVAVKALGDKSVEGKSDEYVSAAFDTLTATYKPTRVDPVRDQLRTFQPPKEDVTDAKGARAEMLERLTKGWQINTQGAH